MSRDQATCMESLDPLTSAKAARPKTSRRPQHFDVLIVGAGISGVGARLSPDQAVSRQELRRARNAGELRRHLVHAPLSRHPLGQRPAHVRLSLQAVAGAPIATADGDPDLHGRGDRGERPRPPYPLPAQDLLGELVERRRTSGPSRPSAPTPASAVRFTANFLWMCQGYYRHSQGYTPEWHGMESFKGRIVHPQTWPEDLDYTGKKVVVIGSGATAATLIPAIADDCAHVTMLQRSPTYLHHRPQRQRARRRAARAADRRGMDPRDRPPQDPARSGRVHPPLVRPSRRSVKQELLGRRARASRPRLRRGHALHAELPAVAAAHRLHSGRRPVPGHRAPARHRSSPTRSSGSPRPASC